MSFLSRIALLLLVAATSVKAAPMSNEDVASLLHAGVGEAVILQAMEESTGKFDTSANALVALKNAGATDAVLQKMVSKTASASPAFAAVRPQQNNSDIEVTVNSVSRSGDPNYHLSNPGYIQIDVDVKNKTTAPLVIFEKQLRYTDGNVIVSLNEAQVVPVLDGTTAGTVGAVGSAAAVLSAVPFANVVVGIGSMVVHKAAQDKRTTARASLSNAMLKNRTVPPGSSSSGIVVFKDDGRVVEAFIVSFLPGGSFDFSGATSVVVPVVQ